MSTRYLYNLALSLVAGFLVVATQAFAAGTVASLTFAVAIGVTAMSLAMAIFRAGIVHRALSGLAAVIGAWTIVASLVFASSTVVWLGFAAGLALVGVGVIGLTVHELTTERVVHSLEVEREPVAA
jgi:hypothetical protein